MFHHHFFYNGFFLDTRDAPADTMHLICACEVEQDLQTNWKEKQTQPDLEGIPAHLGVKPIPSGL